MAAQTITKVPYVDNETVIGAANLNAIQDAVNDHASLIDGLDSGKVDKVTGKGLSTNDFSNEMLQKLNALPNNANLEAMLSEKVPTSRTVNGKALSANVTIGPGDIAYDDQATYPAGSVGAKLSGIGDDVAEITEGVSDLNQQISALGDMIPDTAQTIAYAANGSVQSVTHTRNGTVVRTDTFTFGDDQITEVRTLATGESLTIVTVLSTLVTTITYSEGE